MSAASRDPGELLDIDVHQLAASRGLDAADHTAGRPIHPPQAVAPVAHQDPMHRRCGDPEDAADARRAQLAITAQVKDLPFGHARGLLRAAPGPARAVGKARDPLTQIPAPPLGCGYREMFMDSAAAATDQPLPMR